MLLEQEKEIFRRDSQRSEVGYMIVRVAFLIVIFAFSFNLYISAAYRTAIPPL